MGNKQKVITDNTARVAITLLYSTERSFKEIATQLGINQSSVLRIWKGETFKHLDRPTVKPSWRYG